VLGLVEPGLALVWFLRGRLESERVHQLHVGERERSGQLAAEAQLGGLHVQSFVELVSLPLSLLLFGQQQRVLFRLVRQASLLVFAHSAPKHPPRA